MPTIRILPLTLFISLMPSVAMAQDEVIVVTRQVQESRYPVAVMPFADAGRITDNLTLAGLGATAQNLPQNTTNATDIVNNLGTWRNQGFRQVVLVQTHTMPANKLAISYQLVDTATGSVGVKQTQVSENNSTALAASYAQISDKIYQSITGKPSDLVGKIAFVEETGLPSNKTSMLKLVDMSGKNLATLDTVNGSIMTPSFSPDGRYIAYSVQSKNALPVIYVRSLDNNQLQMVTPFWGHNLAPSFSPDGGSLIFSGSHEANNPNIYRLNLAANSLEKLTSLSGAENSPSYLPDGTGFVYTADHGTRSQSLQKYDFATGKSTQLVARGSSPRVSTDGSKIIYTAAGRIIIANQQGKTLQSFAVAGTETAASFSPSGSRIVYAVNQGNQSQLMIRSLSNNAVQTLPTTGVVRDPVWSK